MLFLLEVDLHGSDAEIILVKVQPVDLKCFSRRWLDV